MSAEQDQMLWRGAVPELPKALSPLPFHRGQQQSHRDRKIFAGLAENGRRAATLLDHGHDNQQ